MSTPKIVVIGSIVVDLPLTLPRDPILGETLLVDSIGLTLGGKAINQGLQAALCDEPVLVIGKVGEDILGHWVIDQMIDKGLDTQGILHSGITSCAVPIILPNAQYILQVPGANKFVTPDDIHETQELWENAEILLLQGEIPPMASLTAAQVAKKRNMLVICDPAPATAITDELLKWVDVLTPNAQELAVLAHLDGGTIEEQVRQVWLKHSHFRALIVTLGDEGVFIKTHDNPGDKIPAPTIKALDPTAAGDAFNGVLAYSIRHGLSWKKACQMGCCAGALAASQRGASISLAPLSSISKMWDQFYSNMQTF
ncbi:ribokinase [Sulfobacillus thermosulfidooxidans]|uniref:ribokinase n=1 Tax=Sulfobacillus thermosulfidooxidans TaxID=28034 RepID=UPI0003082EE6|nr:ribokinase [Sulfobacillus thermosulfidooxidans]